MALAYTVDPAPPAIGLIALQADETLEAELHPLFADRASLFTSRVESGLTVTSESLQAMAERISASAALFPVERPLAAVGYACTSGSAQIGADAVAEKVRVTRPEARVSDPVTALIAACRALGLHRIAILSPYVEEVSDRLRDVLDAAGIATPIFASFDEPRETTVARIDAGSVRSAARSLAGSGAFDAMFVSCTNLRTLAVINDLEQSTGLPVLTSNQVLTWHLAHLAGVRLSDRLPGRLADVEAKD